jgi:hypothetical protein
VRFFDMREEQAKMQKTPIKLITGFLSPSAHKQLAKNNLDRIL